MSQPVIPTPAGGAVPAPPSRSAGAWALDLLIWGGVAALLIYSIDAVDLGNLPRLLTGAANIETISEGLLRPDFTNWRLFVDKMWETVQIALWGTFLAVVLAVPMGLAAARNIAPFWVVQPIRWLMNLLRSVPDLVIGLLFVVVVGLGPLAGVLAITHGGRPGQAVFRGRGVDRQGPCRGRPGDRWLRPAGDRLGRDSPGRAALDQLRPVSL